MTQDQRLMALSLWAGSRFILRDTLSDWKFLESHSPWHIRFGFLRTRIWWTLVSAGLIRNRNCSYRGSAWHSEPRSMGTVVAGRSTNIPRLVSFSQILSARHLPHRLRLARHPHHIAARRASDRGQPPPARGVQSVRAPLASSNVCLVGFPCRTFREELLARP